MRPSLPRLVRVIPRSAVKQAAVGHPKPKIYKELPKNVASPPPLIEVLLQRKAAAGSSYPANIRIEPLPTRATFEGVGDRARENLREILRER
ncbi:hypothetical protein OF83DRAFT_154892 [Amylostereum chailletii]|nr:hypothetical protein OF83DRAFT_154892 [Amylostereum chailletii]